jgi:hypothetical protein
MTDREKLNQVLGWLTDKEVGKQARSIPLTKDETFGAMLFAGRIFNKAYDLINKEENSG